MSDSVEKTGMKGLWGWCDSPHGLASHRKRLPKNIPKLAVLPSRNPGDGVVGGKDLRAALSSK